MQVDASVLPGSDWAQGRVTGRVEWAEGLFSIQVEASVAPFRAGQFLNLGGFDGERWVKRSYSVASAPGQPLEFFIVRVEEGALTPWLAALQPGDAVGVSREAAGHFTLELVPDAPILWLIATGTGLAPYLSMLRGEEPWARFGRVVLVHGVRRRADLAYADELSALSAAHGGRLTVVPVVSRDPEAPGVLHGRIPANLSAIEAAAGAALAPETSQALLCGNPEMVEEVEALLAERGLRKNRKRAPGHVTTERYW